MFSDSSKPKYMEMAETFRKDILSGVYQEGSRLPSDEVIAKTYGINKRTVAAGMAQLVAEGLLTRAPKRGSVVVRQKIVQRHSDMVACVVPWGNDVYGNMEMEISEQTLKRGFYSFWLPGSICSHGLSTPEYKPFRQFLEYMINELPYGMILFGDRFFPYDVIERNLSKVGKLVFICYYVHSRELPANYVLIDFEAAAEKVVSCFAENNHKKMTFLASQARTYRKYDKKTPQHDYHDALKKACRKFGVEYDAEIPEMLWQSSPEELPVIFREIRKRQITAAALSYDAIIYGSYASAIKEVQLSIPDELSVIGLFDTRGNDSGLTTLNIQERTIAATAAEMLFEESNEYKKVYIAPELVERNSVIKL